MAAHGGTTTREASRPAAPIPSPSERERTVQESSASLGDPNEPTNAPWRLNAAMKMRENRLGEIPGWADRLNLSHVAAREGCIAMLPNDHEQAVQRRRLWVRVTVHVALQTALFAVCVFLPSVASVLRTTFSPLWTRFVLFGSLPVALVMLKLVLDAPMLRVVVFLLHSVAVVVLFATTQLVFRLETIFHCFVLVLVMCVVVLVLAGVQVSTRPSNPRSASRGGTRATPIATFLGEKTMGFITLLLTIGVSLLVHFLLPGPSVYSDNTTGAMQPFALAFFSIAMPFEFYALCRTLTPRDAWLGVYLVQHDLLIGLFVAPLAFLSFIVGFLAAGIYVGTCGVLSTLWDLLTGAFGCVVDCHLAPRRRARVGIAAGQTAPSQDG